MTDKPLRTGVSVVVVALKKLDPIGLHQVDASMLLGDAARPDITAQVAQRFRLADAAEGIAEHGLHGSSKRLAVRRSVLIQCCKSSRNSG